MSENESHHHGKNEIIIIKRHGSHEHEAHGGAWKIAYADFMTAMMAFFLVMWLVNAANEETKAAVASYFNPIKLTDSKPAQRGLQKPAKDAEGENTQSKSKDEGEEKSPGSSADTGKDKSSTAGKEVKYSEADYFENPYAVLAEIAKDTNTQANISAKGDGGAADSGPSTGADGGQAFRDPFDPDFWTQQVEVSSAAPSDAGGETMGAGLPDDGTSTAITGVKSDATGTASEGDKKSGTAAAGEMKSGEGFTELNGMTDHPDKKQAAKDQKIKPGEGAEKAGNAGGRKATTGDTEATGKGGQDGEAEKAEGKDKAKGKSPSEKEKLAAKEKQAEAGKLAQKLEAELRHDLAASASKLADGLTVKATDEGLLLSVSDQFEAPMFNVGSSIPRRETVLAMEKIGDVLKAQQGEIIIRGHTDGRQYKSGEFDNWRLSTARAQSAYFMLLKGGFPEGRVGQVSGFADRQLKFPKDPLNDQNRRIEILIRTDRG